MYTPCTRSLFLQKNTHDSRPLLTRDQTVVPGHERYVKALLVQVLIRTLSFHPWFSGFNHIPLGRNCEHLVYLVDGPLLVGRWMGSSCASLSYCKPCQRRDGASAFGSVGPAESEVSALI